MTRNLSRFLAGVVGGSSPSTMVASADTAVSHIELTPDPASVTQYNTTGLAVTVYASDFSVLTGRVVTWQSTNTAVANVDANGQVTGVAPGSARIIATCEGVTDVTTVTVTLGIPPTPAALLAQYNALGAGGVGATMRNVYLRGVNQTTGAGRCTRWGDAITNADASAFVPSPETPTGAAIGGDGGTSIVSDGLELRASYMDSFIALSTVDTGFNTPTPGAPAGINQLFADHTHGWFVGGCGKFLTDTETISLEAAGGSHNHAFAGDRFALWAPLADSLSGLGNALVYPVGSPRIRWGWWFVDTPGSTRADSWIFERFGRDLFFRTKFLNGPDAVLTGRRLRLILTSGQPTGVWNEQNLIYLATGRETKAQNKLINDTIKSWFPDTWEDPRTRLGINLGDSWQEGIDYPLPGGWNPLDIGFAHDVQMGHAGRGLPRLADCAFFSTAYSGDTIGAAQYALAQLIADLDFTTRTRVGVGSGEILNISTPAQNYTLDDFLRSADPKIHVVQRDITFSSNTTAGNFPGYNNDFDANGPTHADAVSHLERGPVSGLNVPWAAHNFGDGTTAAWPTGENPLLWGVAHPTVLFNQLLAPWYQAEILRALGDDLSTRAVKIVPAVDHLDLAVGGAAQSTSFTAYNFADQVVTGKTYTFDVIKLDGTVNPGFSDASAIASTDAAGLVTPHAIGHVVLRVVSNEGAVTFVDINVSAGGGGGGATVSDAFNRANSSTLGNADTGQAWQMLGGSTWGISGNMAYFTNAGGNANDDYAVIDSTKSDTTVQVTFSVLDNTGEPRLAFRVTDVNNMWVVSSGGLLYKRVAGTYTQVGSSFAPMTSGDVVSVVLLGNSITVKVNGVTVLSATDAFNATATKHGLGQFIVGAGTSRYDSFSVL